jgi:hypothetical protein
MSWSSPTTYVAGAILTAAQLNTSAGRDNESVLKTSIADDGRISGEIKKYSEDATSIAVSSNTITIDLSLSNTKYFQATANITTTTISNVAASGKLQSFTLRVKGDGSARTWTWFDSTVKWPGGTAPTRTSTNNKYDWFLFLSLDGGTTWAGAVIGQNLDA